MSCVLATALQLCILAGQWLCGALSNAELPQLDCKASPSPSLPGRVLRTCIIAPWHHHQGVHIEIQSFGVKNEATVSIP